MLIEKQFQKDDVVSLKLTSGEEIIAYYVNENVFLSPLLLVMTQENNSLQGKVHFVPWLIGMDSNTPVKINKEHILSIVQSNSNIKQQYIKALS